MGILEQLRELAKPEESWFIARELPPRPVDVNFDYHVASAINCRMLHSRGSGIGHRNGTVYHAIADRDIRLDRAIRRKGQALCGAKLGDLSSSHEPVTCLRCWGSIQKHKLTRSIKHEVGAWC